MSTRVDTKGREWGRKDAGRLMPFHKPVPGPRSRCIADIGEGETCGAVVYLVVTGPVDEPAPGCTPCRKCGFACAVTDEGLCWSCSGELGEAGA